MKLAQDATLPDNAFAGQAAVAPEPISRDVLEQLHALLSLGPALVDASPTRVLFLTSVAAKTRLDGFLPADEQALAHAAPACAIIGYDTAFAEQLTEFMPQAAGRASCFDSPETVRQTAIRNGGLQGAYLAVAARSLGLETVALANFDGAGVSREFFRSQRLRTTFVCALRHADPQPQRRRAG